jgi:hypothetical protein
MDWPSDLTRKRTGRSARTICSSVCPFFAIVRSSYDASEDHAITCLLNFTMVRFTGFGSADLVLSVGGR